MKTLYIECSMGAAGDMLLAALYELLEDRTGFLETMNHLGLPGVEVTARPAQAGGLAGTHMAVTVHGREEDGADGQQGRHQHAAPGHIAALIDGLPVSEEVRAHAREVYDAIARAEARAHGCPVEEVHFHDVGALDAVADVAGVCYALSLLRPETIVVSPIHVGSGTVRCAHGVLPVPAPATANLLSGAPIYGGEVEGELCTPTGAALLTHFAQSFGPMPAMTLRGVGVGVGSRIFPGRANCVRAFLGEAEERPGGEITELVCNIDDMTPEALAFACTRLLELGALDVYTTPGTMKKGRAGHVLTVLCPPERETEMARHILTQTTTNGLRVRRCGKYALTPGAGQVQTPLGPVRLKLARGYGVTHKKPEFEDVAALARAKGLSYGEAVRAVWESVEGGEAE